MTPDDYICVNEAERSDASAILKSSFTKMCYLVDIQKVGEFRESRAVRTKFTHEDLILNVVNPEQYAKLYSSIVLIFGPYSKDSSFVQPINVRGSIFVN